MTVDQQANIDTGTTLAVDSLAIQTDHCDDGATLTVDGVTYIREGGEWVQQPEEDQDDDR